MKSIIVVGVMLSVAFLSGCSTYVTPGGGADFAAITSSTMRESFAAKPAARFPAAIVCARIQAPDYKSHSMPRGGGAWGYGQYRVITTREVEDHADIDRLAHLPEVADVIGLNRLLLPGELSSEAGLREAAARLKSDLLVLYTFDTAFFAVDASRPLTVLTLGLLPTRNVHVTVTASALVVDTRTGFLHAALETTERREVVSSALGTAENVDRARRDAEKVAFGKLVDEFEGNWLRIVDRGRQGV